MNVYCAKGALLKGTVPLNIFVPVHFLIGLEMAGEPFLADRLG